MINTRTLYINKELNAEETLEMIVMMKMNDIESNECGFCVVSQLSVYLMYQVSCTTFPIN